MTNALAEVFRPDAKALGSFILDANVSHGDFDRLVHRLGDSLFGHVGMLFLDEQVWREAGYDEEPEERLDTSAPEIWQPHEDFIEVIRWGGGRLAYPNDGLDDTTVAFFEVN